MRVFRFDEAINEWHIVARSGVSLNGDYAWAKLNKAGLYVPIGLPRDPWLFRIVMAIRSYSTWLRAARKVNSVERMLESICQLISGNGVFDSVRGNLGLADELGLPAFEAERYPDDLLQLCLSIDLQEGGLPESEILNDHDFIIDPTPGILAASACTNWVSVGPNNINGRIKSLAIHPTDGNTVYAGGADGGVWKTKDGGSSWTPTMQIELSMAIGALGLAASNPNVLYAATGEDVPGWGPSYAGVGVYKTIDAGNDWNLLPPIASLRCSRVLVHPTNPDIVYVAGERGLHRSMDGGASWRDVRTDHVSDALMDPLAPNVIYAAVWNSGVYKSTDSGATWALLSNGIPTASSADWIKLAMGRNGTNGTQFLVAKMGTDSGLVFKSTNGGASWTAVPGTHQPAGYNEWTNMVAVDPNDENIIFAGGPGLERSSNGGASFTEIGGTHADHHALVFSPTDSRICYLATDGGVFKSSNNGTSWSLKSKGLVCTQLFSIGVAQTSPFVMGSATQDQGVIKSTGGTDWTDTGAGNEGGVFVVDQNNSNIIFATPASDKLRRSTDRGTTWTTITNGLGLPTPDVNHVAVKPGASNELLCVAGNKVFRSANQGTTWDAVLEITGKAKRVAFSPSAPNVCYATTDQGQVFRSSSSGTLGSWSEPYTAANRPPVGYITAVVVDRRNPDLVCIAYGGTGLAHVLKSTDRGAHWVKASGALPSDALPDVPLSALVIDQNNSEVVYVATDVGAFRTRDGGDSWEPFDDNMPRVVTTDLILHKNTNTLYASTMGRGAFKRVL